MRALATLFAVAALSACGASSTGARLDGGGSTGASGGGSTTSSTGSSGHGSSGGSSGGSSTGGTSGGILALQFDPPEATLVVDGTTPQTASFSLRVSTAAGTFTTEPDSIQFDRPDLATVELGQPIVATAPSPLGLLGGVGTLHALYQGREALATLEVVVNEVAYGAGVSAGDDAVAALSASDLAADPAANIRPVLYPYDGTVWPLGLTSPPIMWNAPQTGDVYRLHYAETNYSYDAFVRLDALPASVRIAQDAWDRLTASNQAATFRDPLTFTLSRWDAQARVAYVVDSETWTISPASLRGAIYYWTTSNGGSLSRIPAGAGAQPQALAGPNGNNCMGCHAVSADGSTLVAGVRGQSSVDASDDRAWTSFDLPTGSVRHVSDLFAGNLAISPDGRFVVSGSEHLKVSDSHTGLEFGDAGLASLMLDANMTGIATPAFSPDGTLLAAIEQGGNDWQYWDVNLNPNSELVTVGFDAASVTFSNVPQKLADATQFATGEQTINYPSFSPDSSRVAFQVADHNSGCWTYPDGCQNTTPERGAIWLVDAQPGHVPVRLSRLSDPPEADGGDLSLEPTFNPVRRGGYDWLVFTSERAWGNSADVTGPADNDKKRLWVSAVDADLPDGGDPSHPAFFLEGQDVTTQNMRGFWTLSACIPSPGDSELGGETDAGACVNGFDCCSGFCNHGACVGVNQVSCAGLDATCTSDADCCNAPTVSCNGGVCLAPLQWAARCKKPARPTTIDFVDAPTFDELIAAHGPALGRLAAAYESDADRRRDLGQEIQLALWRALPAFRGGCSPRTFALRVAHNVAASHALRGQRDWLRRSATLEELELPDGREPDAALDARRLLERVRTLVQRLKPIDRQVLLLHLEGLAAAEVAEVTGLSANNVAVKIHRVRALLGRAREPEVAP